ncbi:MAG: hypothetical protein ABI606_12550 [Rhodoferax sp.]
MKNCGKVARLSSVGNRFQLSFDGISYVPTVDAHGTGVLLFGLRPAGIDFDCNRSPALFLLKAQAAAMAMHDHANRIQLVAEKTLTGWMGAAVALAPNEEHAMNVHNLIVDNLGPDAIHLKK